MKGPVFMRRELFFRKCDFCNVFEVTDKAPSGDILHAHDYAQIWYVTRGQCDHYVEDQSYKMTAGDTFLIPPMAEHRTVLAGNSAAISCEFALEYLFTDSSGLTRTEMQSYLNRMSVMNFMQDSKTRRPRFQFRPEVMPKVDRLMKEILEEFREEKPCYQDILRVKLQELLLLYIREFITSPDYKATDAAYERYRVLMTKAISYIDEHYTESLSLENVCRLFSLSKTYFCYLFKLMTKKTFVEYITDRRIQEAMRLLKDSNCTVQAVSELTGFHSTAHFSRTFKKSVGISPRVYRKMRNSISNGGDIMADFSELTTFLDNVSSRYGIPGCDCAVTIDGRAAYRHGAGYKDEETKTPVSRSDTYWIYSATKLFTCTAALQLIEQGKMALEDPVSRYLPEFGALTVRQADGTINPAREVLTVRHLMTMTGGLDYDMARPALRRALDGGATRTRDVVAALAEDPLQFEPGSHFLYSLCHDVLGAVIEQAAQMSLADYIKRNITDPLGMADTTFHPSAAQLERLSTQYAHLDEKGTHRPIGQGNQFRFTEAYDSGGAGLLSTVDDYIRLATALALGGVSPEGVRILSDDSVERMRTAALDPVQRHDFLIRSPAAKGYSYGLGVQVMVEDIGTGVPIGEFGWDGAAGAYVLIDPSNRLAMFYAQQVCNSRVTYQEIHPTLRDTLYRCLGRECDEL